MEEVKYDFVLLKELRQMFQQQALKDLQALQTILQAAPIQV
jgi:hypothetical protein